MRHIYNNQLQRADRAYNVSETTSCAEMNRQPTWYRLFHIAIWAERVLWPFNPLNAELNPICHLLALLEGATIVVVSRLRVNFEAL